MSTRIVYLASNPLPTSPIELEAQSEAIRRALSTLPPGAGELPIDCLEDASTQGLRRALDNPSVQVLHIAGHGRRARRGPRGRGVMTTDGEGHNVLLGARGLDAILRQTPNIRLVVLSACQSAEQAQAIADACGCAVGITGKLEDSAARRFAEAFYEQLARGRSVKAAFDWAQAFFTAEYEFAEGEFGEHGLFVRAGHRADRVFIEPVGAQAPAAGPASAAGPALAEPRIDGGFGDVVLTANLDRPWQAIIPHDPGASPLHLDLSTPPGGWQRAEPDAVEWRQVAFRVHDVVDEIARRKPRRIFVIVRTAFSIGALIARGIEDHGERVFYQFAADPDLGGAKRWMPWGPHPAGGRGPGPNLFFNRPALPDHPVEESYDVLFLASVTGQVPEELARKAVGADPARRHEVRLMPLTGPDQDALSTGSIDRAARELERAIQRTCERFPNGRVHLFYFGPLALLMRASGRLHLRSTPVILYEYFPRTTPGGPCYRPALDCGPGRLLIDGP